MRETYHIETLAPGGIGPRVVQRTSIRADTVEAAGQRALRILRRALVPQTFGPAIDAVRVLNGAGHEVFSVSARDEAVTRRRR